MTIWSFMSNFSMCNLQFLTILFGSYQIFKTTSDKKFLPPLIYLFSSNRNVVGTLVDSGLFSIPKINSQEFNRRLSKRNKVIYIKEISLYIHKFYNIYQLVSIITTASFQVCLKWRSKSVDKEKSSSLSNISLQFLLDKADK